MSTGQVARLAFFSPDLLDRTPAGAQILDRLPSWAQESHEVTVQVLEAVAQTEAPSGVVAILEFPGPAPLSDHARDRLGLVLDGVGDPGNVGTMLRTADALGTSYVLTHGTSVDPYAPKVVRAAMGAHFRLDVYPNVCWQEALAQLPGVEVIAAVAAGGEPVMCFDWPDRGLLALGSEAHGLSAEVEESAATRVHIPMRRGVESLNAAVAASILMYSALADVRPWTQSVTDERI
jgi:TrmH family RNA methyltransferase